MNWKALACLPAVLVLASAMSGQSPNAAPACPSTATLDQLIKAIDAAVSGPANQDRTCFRALFLPDAKLMPLVKNKDDGSVAPRILPVEGWIEAVAKRGNDVFTEKQLSVKTETWGNEAHLWSTYMTSSADGKTMDRGINSIQAVFDGKSWKVISILWQAESLERPLPAKYLP